MIVPNRHVLERKWHQRSNLKKIVYHNDNFVKLLGNKNQKKGKAMWFKTVSASENILTTKYILFHQPVIFHLCRLIYLLRSHCCNFKLLGNCVLDILIHVKNTVKINDITLVFKMIFLCTSAHRKIVLFKYLTREGAGEWFHQHSFIRAFAVTIS